MASVMRRPATSHRRRWMVAIAGLTVVLVLTACAAGPNTAAGQGAGNAGFWLGLWQGFIAPITFVISLFSDRVAMYAVHNAGHWYDIGVPARARGAVFRHRGRRIWSDRAPTTATQRCLTAASPCPTGRRS